MYKFKRRLEEISEGIEKSKFPSVTKSKFLQEIIQTIIRRSNGDSMQKVVSKLEVKDKEIGDNLLTAFERMKYLENDPEFKLVKELKYSKSYKKEIKGEPVIYKCQGEVPIPLIDLLAFLADDNETKSWYDNLFVKEELLRKIHPDIQIIRQAYKATWPTAPRDFIMGSWIHLTQEGHAYIIATSCQDPLGPKVRGYVRGQVICGGWILKPITSDRTNALYVSQLDLAGSIPGFVKDSVASTQGEIIDRVFLATPKYLANKEKTI